MSHHTIHLEIRRERERIEQLLSLIPRQNQKDVSDSYFDAIRAYVAGDSVSDNPEDYGSRDHKDWQDGYNDAERADSLNRCKDARSRLGKTATIGENGEAILH